MNKNAIAAVIGTLNPSAKIPTKAEPVAKDEQIKDAPPVSTPTKRKAAKTPENRPIEKSGQMGRPNATHNRKPFTSRCNAETWGRIKLLADARNVEPGEIVELAFAEYLQRNKTELSNFLTSQLSNF